MPVILKPLETNLNEHAVKRNYLVNKMLRELKIIVTTS